MGLAVLRDSGTDSFNILRQSISDVADSVLGASTPVDARKDYSDESSLMFGISEFVITHLFIVCSCLQIVHQIIHEKGSNFLHLKPEVKLCTSAIVACSVEIQKVVSSSEFLMPVRWSSLNLYPENVDVAKMREKVERNFYESFVFWKKNMTDTTHKHIALLTKIRK